MRYSKKKMRDGYRVYVWKERPPEGRRGYGFAKDGSSHQYLRAIHWDGPFWLVTSGQLSDTVKQRELLPMVQTWAQAKALDQAARLKAALREG